MSQQHESTVVSYSNKESLSARSELFNVFKNYDASEGELERSMGLFLRGSLLARIFAIRELYEQIVMLPGVIMDIGTWRGQTAVVCENLRAIFEPLHLNRRIVCFDTFEGYKGFSDKDKKTDLHQDGTYKISTDYAEQLRGILRLHEKNNAMGHIFDKHKVIQGDCRKTLPGFFEQHSNEVVSLAFFDVNSYEVTLEAFKTVYARTVPGGIIAFWQLTRDIIPAEGMVYAEQILNTYGHQIKRSKFYPGLCYLVKE